MVVSQAPHVNVSQSVMDLMDVNGRQDLALTRLISGHRHSSRYLLELKRPFSEGCSDHCARFGCPSLFSNNGKRLMQLAFFPIHSCASTNTCPACFFMFFADSL